MNCCSREALSREHVTTFTPVPVASLQSHAVTETQDEQGAEQNEFEAFGKNWTIGSLTVAVVFALL